MAFKFSKASYEKLIGVRPELVSVMTLTLLYSPIDFKITEGMRSLERQKQLKAEGKSQTLNSRHLTGHAIDFVALPDGKVSWDFNYYKLVTDAAKKASLELNVPIVWGGDWKTLVDGPHIELDRGIYA